MLNALVLLIAGLMFYQGELTYLTQDCLGALDGTCVPVTVLVEAQGRYCNRKHQLATNVFRVCEHKMKFVYVLPGWEGSALDSRVLPSPLARFQPFVIPTTTFS